MKLWILFAGAAGLAIGAASIAGAAWDLPPVDTTQVGYRGTGMFVSKDREDEAANQTANQVPEAPWEADPSGEKAGSIYENVQVLGDLSDDQFNQFMASITAWVAPEAEGCNYCHNPENLASDEVYTKVVARRMIQMTQAINVNWDAHVAATGVTCYTCHRGNAVPANVWSTGDGEGPAVAMLGYNGGQNGANEITGSTSLPGGALDNFLLANDPIRVHSNTALPTGENTTTTKETERTWGLMMHMSESLGANCVTCHNSRAFNDWDQSPPQRVTAWHGIRMTNEINNAYMADLAPVFPDNRKGPNGDVLKANCGTCHNGVQKPLYGVSMLGDYVDALGTITNEEKPDFASYVPGETQMLGKPPAVSQMPEPVPAAAPEAGEAMPADDAAAPATDPAAADGTEAPAQ